MNRLLFEKPEKELFSFGGLIEKDKLTKTQEPDEVKPTEQKINKKSAVEGKKKTLNLKKV